MILQYVVFGAVLAIFPAIGIVAARYSYKQRKLEAEREHGRHAASGC